MSVSTCGGLIHGGGGLYSEVYGILRGHLAPLLAPHSDKIGPHFLDPFGNFCIWSFKFFSSENILLAQIENVSCLPRVFDPILPELVRNFRHKVTSLI